MLKKILKGRKKDSQLRKLEIEIRGLHTKISDLKKSLLNSNEKFAYNEIVSLIRQQHDFEDFYITSYVRGEYIDMCLKLKSNIYSEDFIAKQETVIEGIELGKYYSKKLFNSIIDKSLFKIKKDI